MPNPVPFLWTVLSMTLASCRLGEHGLTLKSAISNLDALKTKRYVCFHCSGILCCFYDF